MLEIAYYVYWPPTYYAYWPLTYYAFWSPNKNLRGLFEQKRRFFFYA